MTIWLQAMYLMCASKKGISTRQLQRMIGCGLKTAWFLSMRIREAMKETQQFFDEPLAARGEWLRATKPMSDGRPRAALMNLQPPSKGHGLGAARRSVRSFHVPNVTAANLQPIIAKHIHMDSRYVTDSSTVSTMLGLPFRGRHQMVNHSAKEYVRGDVYTNTVEGYFSILKRGIYGVYQHVSEAHLQRYLTEFDFRYSNRAKLGVDDVERTDLAIQGAQGRRLTYRKVGGGGTTAYAT